MFFSLHTRCDGCVTLVTLQSLFCSQNYRFVQHKAHNVKVILNGEYQCGSSTRLLLNQIFPDSKANFLYCGKL